MINTLKRATKLAPWLSVAAILATATPASAQAPSQAQRDAVLPLPAGTTYSYK